MKDPQHWAELPVFDPEQAAVIRQPQRGEPGYWVGAPGVFFDAVDELFYLTYRIRRPRGVTPDRGAEVHLARSRDGVEFETIWQGTKADLGTSSIERSALRWLGPDAWALYVSYVDPADGRWRIDLVEAARPDAFDLTHRKSLLGAEPLGLEGIKDPFVMRLAGGYQMLVSIANSVGEPSDDELHQTQDAYNTGLIRSASGLLTSQDGRHWCWCGEVFGPSHAGWDSYCARIGTLWREDGLWIGLYDGSQTVQENYEERVGVAISSDLRSWQRITDRSPWMTPADPKKALRYFDVLALPDATYLYFEMARPDGSHDLRVARLG